LKLIPGLRWLAVYGDGRPARDIKLYRRISVRRTYSEESIVEDLCLSRKDNISLSNHQHSHDDGLQVFACRPTLMLY